MTIQDLFVLSNQALASVVAEIPEDKWGMAMPPGTSMRPSSLQQAVQYHTYDDAWVPDVLAGKTKEEVGEVYEPLTAESLAPGEVLVQYQKYNQAASDAVRGFHDLDKVVHLSYGDFPADEYLRHSILFRAFRSYDIAKMTGLNTTMDPELVTALAAELGPHLEEYRKLGVFPAALAVADDADPQTKLLASVGRE